MTDKLVYTNALNGDDGHAYLMGMYQTVEGSIYLRDLGAMI